MGIDDRKSATLVATLVALLTASQSATIIAQEKQPLAIRAVALTGDLAPGVPGAKFAVPPQGGVRLPIAG